jgi:putative addiction module killer protein
MEVVAVQELCDERGRSYFGRCLDTLDSQTAIKVTRAINRLSCGYFSNVKSLRAGLFEYKIDYGRGYRVYFGREHNTLIILLGGGSKRTQSKDIDLSKTLWQHYKKTKQKG